MPSKSASPPTVPLDQIKANLKGQVRNIWKDEFRAQVNQHIDTILHDPATQTENRIALIKRVRSHLSATDKTTGEYKREIPWSEIEAAYVVNGNNLPLSIRKALTDRGESEEMSRKWYDPAGFYETPLARFLKEGSTALSFSQTMPSTSEAGANGTGQNEETEKMNKQGTSSVIENGLPEEELKTGSVSVVPSTMSSPLSDVRASISPPPSPLAEKFETKGIKDSIEPLDAEPKNEQKPPATPRAIDEDSKTVLDAKFKTDDQHNMKSKQEPTSAVKLNGVKKNEPETPTKSTSKRPMVETKTEKYTPAKRVKTSHTGSPGTQTNTPADHQARGTQNEEPNFTAGERRLLRLMLNQWTASLRAQAEARDVLRDM